MPYQFLRNAFFDLQNRFGNQIASETTTKLSKEGQCDEENEGEVYKMCETELDAFKQQNAEVLE